MVNQWRPRVGATSKVWWQVRWPDPMWANDTVVSHPGYLISQVGKGRRLEQLEQGVGRLQQQCLACPCAPVCLQVQPVCVVAEPGCGGKSFGSLLEAGGATQVVEVPLAQWAGLVCCWACFDGSCAAAWLAGQRCRGCKPWQSDGLAACCVGGRRAVPLCCVVVLAALCIVCACIERRRTRCCSRIARSGWAWVRGLWLDTRFEVQQSFLVAVHVGCVS